MVLQPDLEWMNDITLSEPAGDMLRFITVPVVEQLRAALCHPLSGGALMFTLKKHYGAFF